MKNTKLILTHEVENLGTSGDVVEVAAGYARNYLLPRGLAQPWTKGAQRQIDQMVRARRSRAIANVEDARAVRDALEKVEQVTIAKRSSQDGRLFGSVSAAEVAEAIKTQAGQAVDRRKITLDEPIKSVGAHSVTVKLHEDVSVKVRVLVQAA